MNVMYTYSGTSWYIYPNIHADTDSSSSQYAARDVSCLFTRVSSHFRTRQVETTTPAFRSRWATLEKQLVVEKLRK